MTACINQFQRNYLLWKLKFTNVHRKLFLRMRTSTLYYLILNIMDTDFFSMALPAHSGPRPLIQFRNHFSQSVGLLGRVISSSQGRYLHTGKHRQNKRIHIHTKHPCLKCDSNPRSQSSSERRQFMS
jgi:hypothetical protein